MRASNLGPFSSIHFFAKKNSQCNGMRVPNIQYVTPRGRKVLVEYDRMSKMTHKEKSKVQNTDYTVTQIRQHSMI
jgi:hypothetical protein